MKTIHTTETFDDWFVGLRDRMAQKRIQARIRPELGNFGDCEPVGEGVSEFGFTTGRATAYILYNAEWKL